MIREGEWPWSIKDVEKIASYSHLFETDPIILLGIVPLLQRGEVYFHDGAPAQNGIHVREFLNSLLI